jgi:hypothetical protein
MKKKSSSKSSRLPLFQTAPPGSSPEQKREQTGRQLTFASLAAAGLIGLTSLVDGAVGHSRVEAHADKIEAEALDTGNPRPLAGELHLHKGARVWSSPHMLEGGNTDLNQNSTLAFTVEEEGRVQHPIYVFYNDEKYLVFTPGLDSGDVSDREDRALWVDYDDENVSLTSNLAMDGVENGAFEFNPDLGVFTVNINDPWNPEKTIYRAVGQGPAEYRQG